MTQSTTLFSKAVPLVLRAGNHPAHKQLYVTFVVINGTIFNRIARDIDPGLCAAANINMATIGDAADFLEALTANHDARPVAELIEHMEFIADRCGIDSPVQVRRYSHLPSAYVLRNTPSGLVQLRAAWQKGIWFDKNAPASYLFFEQLPPLEPASYRHFCIERHSNDPAGPKLKLMRDDETGQWGLFFLSGTNRLNNEPILLDRNTEYTLKMIAFPRGSSWYSADVGHIEFHLYGKETNTTIPQHIHTALYEGVPTRAVNDTAVQFSPRSVQQMLDMVHDEPLCHSVWSDALHTTKIVMDDYSGALPAASTTTLLPGDRPARPPAATPPEQLLRGQSNVVPFSARKTLK